MLECGIKRGKDIEDVPSTTLTSRSLKMSVSERASCHTMQRGLNGQLLRISLVQLIRLIRFDNMLPLVKSSRIQQIQISSPILRQWTERISAKTSTAPSGVYSVCCHETTDALLEDEKRNATKQTVHRLFM